MNSETEKRNQAYTLAESHTMAGLRRWLLPLPPPDRQDWILRHHLGPLCSVWAGSGLLDDLQFDDTLSTALHQHYIVQQTHTLTLCHDALKLLDLAHAQGIPAIAVKGLCHLATLYHDTALRPMHDIDLLVHPEHIDSITTAAMTLNYQPHPMPNSNLLLMRKTATSSFCIELHVHICQPRRYPVDRKALWDDAVTVDWNGHRLHVLDPVHRFVHTLINLVHDRFDAPLLKFMEAHWQFLRLSQHQRNRVAVMALSCECSIALKLLLDILFYWFEHDIPGGLQTTAIEHFKIDQLPPYQSGLTRWRDMMFSAKLMDKPKRRFSFAWDCLLRYSQIRPRRLQVEDGYHYPHDFETTDNTMATADERR